MAFWVPLQVSIFCPKGMSGQFSPSFDWFWKKWSVSVGHPVAVIVSYMWLSGTHQWQDDSKLLIMTLDHPPRDHCSFVKPWLGLIKYMPNNLPTPQRKGGNGRSDGRLNKERQKIHSHPYCMTCTSSSPQDSTFLHLRVWNKQEQQRWVRYLPTFSHARRLIITALTLVCVGLDYPESGRTNSSPRPSLFFYGLATLW